MKKLFLITALLLLFGVIAGCGTNEPASPLQLIEAQPSPTPSVDPPRVTFEPWANYKEYIPDIQISWGYYKTLADFCERMQNIAVVTVENIEVFERTSSELSGTDLMFHETRVKYSVNIDQSIKGNLTSGKKISIWRQEWKFGDTNVYHADMPPLDYNKTYLMSFNDNKYPISDLDISYIMGAPFESYPEIIDGKLYPHERSSLFFKGESLEEAIIEIQEAVFSIIPINIPIEQSIEILTLWLISYADGFAPVRDLTDEELQEFYDFENSDFVTAVVGKQLQNGYKVVWIKTSELDRDQQSEFYEALNATAQAMADEAGIHAKVSCNPFDSLITLIGANEDNASVHMQFDKMQSREEYIQKTRFLPWETFENNLPKILQAVSKGYDSISELAQDSDFIVVATLKDIRVTVRNGGGSELQYTIIEYILELDQNIKNQYDYFPGSNFALKQEGFRHEGVNIYRSDAPPLEYGKTYLIFANEDFINMSRELYPEVVDGRLYPHESSKLFYEGMLLEDVIAQIE